MSTPVESPKRPRDEEPDTLAGGSSSPSPSKRARLSAPSATTADLAPGGITTGSASGELAPREPSPEPSLDITEVPRSTDFWFPDGGESLNTQQDMSC